jgi:hypothetical protein
VFWISISEMNANKLKAIAKDNILQFALSLSASDISFLVDALSEKDDTARYNAFCLLRENSRKFSAVYQHWDAFVEKLESSNSYQRSLGVMLMSENVKWDSDGKFKQSIERYLSCCLDEKFIAARQAIQGLETIIGATSNFNTRIKEALTHLSLDKYKANQQKLLNKDIVKVLKIIEGKTAKL